MSVLEKKVITRNAIILAAGFGMRMVPINTEVPKGLVEIDGEPLIERQIKQLHEVGIKEIYIVVGFMKECYEYLMDTYGVELIVNPEYAVKNNLHSLYLASDKISSTYIVPCDIWSRDNPFAEHELYSWYMISNTIDLESFVRINRKLELRTVKDFSGGNKMVGISYLTGNEAKLVKERLRIFSQDMRHNECFWEVTLHDSKW